MKDNKLSNKENKRILKTFQSVFVNKNITLGFSLSIKEVDQIEELEPTSVRDAAKNAGKKFF